MPSIVDQRIRSEKVRRCVNNSLRYLSMNMYIRPHHCQNSLPLYQFHDAFRHVILYRYWPRRSWNITFRWTAKSYIFPRGYIFPKRAALRENIITRENITILAPPTRDISSVAVNICYIRWSKWMISSKFDGALWLSWSLVTRSLCAVSIMTFYC